jgi:formyl-CoA transferase
MGYGYTNEHPHRRESLGAGFVQCADGYIQFPVTGGNPRMWNRLVQLLEMPELGEDPRFLTPALRMQNQADIAEIVLPWLMTQNKRDIAEKSQALGFNAAPVLDISEVIEDPHHNERGFFVDIDHPVAGNFRYPGAPFKLQEGGWQIRRPAPLLGQHNNEIYQGKLGYTEQELSNLHASGVI